jgi:hypothetical protein
VWPHTRLFFHCYSLHLAPLAPARIWEAVCSVSVSDCISAFDSNSNDLSLTLPAKQRPRRMQLQIKGPHGLARLHSHSNGCSIAYRRPARPLRVFEPAPSANRPPTAPAWGHCQRLQPVRSFEGDAAKALQEAAALDELIDKMLSAKSQQEVSERSCSFRLRSWNSKEWNVGIKVPECKLSFVVYWASLQDLLEGRSLAYYGLAAALETTQQL